MVDLMAECPCQQAFPFHFKRFHILVQRTHFHMLRARGQTGAEVIGPASPGIDKIKDIYRRVLYIKEENYGALVGIKDRVEKYIEINSGFDKMRIQFDFNPM